MASERTGAPRFGGNAEAYLLLTLTTLGWGANAVLGRLAVGEVSPMALTCLRWLIALGLLALLARRQLRRDWPLLRQRLWFLAAMGSLGFTGFNGLFYVAAHSTSAVNLGIVQGSIPVFVLLGAFLAYRLPVSALQGVGVAVTLVGVAILASGGEVARLMALAFNHGDLLTVVACLLYAGYTVGLQRRPQVSALALVTVLAAAAFLSSIPLALAEAAFGQLQWPTARGWLVIAGVAIIPSVLSQIFFIRGVALLGPGRAGIFVNLVPIFAAVLGVVFLHEPFEPYHAVALALVLGGIAISERGKPG